MDLCLSDGRDIVTGEYLIRGHPLRVWELTIHQGNAMFVIGGGNTRCIEKDYRIGLKSGTHLATMALGSRAL